MVTSLMDVPAHVVAPPGVELKLSGVSDNETGAWCTEKVTQGSKFGPFVGRTLPNGKAKKVDFRYAWEVYDQVTNKLVHIVDATDPQHGNWMRFVNCARYLEEQNLVSIQEGSDIYYRAIRDIAPGEELLTWYAKEDAQDDSKTKRKRKDSVKDTDKDVSPAVTPTKVRKKPGPKPKVKNIDLMPKTKCESQENKTVSPRAETPDAKAKQRKRKKASREDYVEGDDLDELVNLSKETLKAGVKEGVIKERKINKNNLNGKRNGKSPRGSRGRGSPTKSISSPRGRGRGKLKSGVSRSEIKSNKSTLKSPSKNSARGRGRGKNSPVKVGAKTAQSPSSRNKIADKLWNTVQEMDFTSSSAKEGEYNFEILPLHRITGKMGRKMYKCDVCAGIYRHAFSLKRHYLRNHIYCYYLSEADISNCKIIVKQQESLIKNRPKNLPPKLFLTPDAQSDTKNALKGTDKSSNNAKTQAEDSSNVKKSRSSVQSRARSLSYPGLYRCCTCNKLFDFIEDLKVHTEDHPSQASEKLFSCSQCKMKFTYRQNLMRHQAVHTGTRPFSCKNCKQSFPNVASLRKHEKTHVGRVPKCKHCKAGFTWRVELKRHMQKLHPEYLHHCPYCEKSFLSRCAFQKHLISHDKDPYPDTKETVAATKKKSPTKNKKKVLKKSVKGLPAKSPAKKQAKPIVKKTPVKIKTQSQSNMKYTCSVCKERFTNYVKMCQHKKQAHPVKPPTNFKSDTQSFVEALEEEVSKVTVKNAAEVKIEPEEWRPCDAKFFAGVADNIADNLCNHIDGGVHSMKDFYTHIRIEDYKSISEVHDLDHSPLSERDQIWTKYNFPSGYEPIMTPEEISDGIVFARSQKTKLGDHLSSLEDRKPPKTPISTPLVIKIPEFHRCSVCNCVFSNTESYEWHKKEKHKQSPSVEIKKEMGSSEKHSEIVNNGVEASDSVDVANTYLDPGILFTHSQNAVETSKESEVVSPFRKYEEIEFGKNGELKFICGVCKKEFLNTMDLSVHQFKKHATVDCTFLEVENGFCVEKLFYPVPMPSGELAEIKKKPLDSRESHSFTCTRCLSHFSTVTRLYIHIMNCAPKPKAKSIPGKTSGQFASQRSPVVKNRFKEDEKKRKSTSKGTEDIAPSKDKLKALRGHKDANGAEDHRVSEVLHGTHHRQRGGLLYNPRNHVRRREMTDVLERHQCKGCGCKFQTISLLERHIKKCDEKEKLKSVKPLKRPSSEHPNSKLSCQYCSRQFTYLKFLVNHYRRFCHVRKERASKGMLTLNNIREEDRIKAASISAANKEFERRESTEVALQTEGPVMAKRGWPRGMKRKKGRKNHCWTYIKKRKSPELARHSSSSSVHSYESGSSDLSKLQDGEKLSEDASQETASGKIECEGFDDYSENSQQSDNIDNSQGSTSKKKRLTLLDSKAKASMKEIAIPFDPSFLPMQQNKAFKHLKSNPSSSKRHLLIQNATLHEKNNPSAENEFDKKSLPALTGLVAIPKRNQHIGNKTISLKIHDDSNKSSENMANKSTSLNIHDASVNTTKSSENMVNKSTSLKISDVSVDSGIGSPSVLESPAVKAQKGESVFLGSADITVTNGLEETNPNALENTSDTKSDSDMDDSMDKVARLADSKDAKQLTPAPDNSNKLNPEKTTMPSERNSTKLTSDQERNVTKLLPPKPNSDEGVLESLETASSGNGKSLQETVPQESSSDEDDMVLQRFVDMKTKPKTEQKPLKNPEEISNTQDKITVTEKQPVKKKALVQTTLLKMFPKTKSAKMTVLKTKVKTESPKSPISTVESITVNADSSSTDSVVSR